ncbi:MAG: alpha/beta fold hydrolase [Rhodobacter sp.]|nr:alpha/beta fold hydrolase [Rhodobacter sp.]
MTGPDETLRRRLRALLALPDSVPAAVGEGSTGALRLDGLPAAYLKPPGSGPFPAVLYCHAHGGEYDLGRRELTEGARWLAAPYAPDLVAAGFAVLCIDMPGFGDRRSEGSESALAKAALWRGQPLFARMLKDQLSAFGWLQQQPDIDPTRIVTLGMSMGAALAMWVAAMVPGVAGCIQLCMLADIDPLIASGTHARHGDYLTVPGFLNHADTGDVAVLIAPRAQFIAHGAADHLTPAPARDPALERVRVAYARGNGLETFLSPQTGHLETPEMREAVLKFLNRFVSQT